LTEAHERGSFSSIVSLRDGEGLCYAYLRIFSR